MEQLEEKVLKTIKKYGLIKNGDNIVVGVSGGPDSMTLVNVLNNIKEQLEIKIFVAHINHMIREEADKDAKFVQNYCDSKGMECYIKEIDVREKAKKLKISTELAGRNARYSFFEEVAKEVGANKIATAHTANDNAETVLMNLMRGSGISGLKGIEKIRDGKFIRPIIECTRKEIEEYCRENELNPQYDKTNQENIYTRNKIRNLLIPFIEKEFNPNIIESLNRLSHIASNEDEFFHKIVENEFNNLNITGDNIDNKTIILNLKKFNNLDDVIKSRMIIYTISKLLGNSQGIEKIHIEDIIKLCENNIGNKYLMPNKKIKVFIKKGKIFFISVM